MDGNAVSSENIKKNAEADCGKKKKKQAQGWKYASESANIAF